MLYLRTAPVGIDEVIQNKQAELYGYLLEQWGLQPSDYNCYGRCNRNQTDEGYLPEVYTGAQDKEYDDAFLNDNIAVTSFFGYNRSLIPDGGMFIANVHLIFAVNLAKIYPAIKWRADEEARLTVTELFKYREDFLLTEILIDIEKVFAEYTAWRHPDKGINYRDMQPFHFFRLNFTARYNPIITSCF